MSQRLEVFESKPKIWKCFLANENNFSVACSLLSDKRNIDVDQDHLNY